MGFVSSVAAQEEEVSNGILIGLIGGIASFLFGSWICNKDLYRELDLIKEDRQAEEGSRHTGLVGPNVIYYLCLVVVVSVKFGDIFVIMHTPAADWLLFQSFHFHFTSTPSLKDDVPQLIH